MRLEVKQPYKIAATEKRGITLAQLEDVLHVVEHGCGSGWFEFKISDEKSRPKHKKRRDSFKVVCSLFPVDVKDAFPG
eukprot:3200975-Amphidinium_carterae.1